MNSTEHILTQLTFGTSNIIPFEELRKKISSGKKLIIKLGADPTSPDLHLGHAVVLSKMRQLQDLGHKIVFLIGDFTARIGDPTGRSKTRPPLTEEEIRRNSETYLHQVGKVLDISNISIRYNSEWLDQLTSKEWVQLCGKVTLARIIEREDFAKRIEQHAPIGFHELLYPLMQGYDSVALKADIELGGTDQTFNLLMGRYLQEQFGQEPQVVITTPLLEGLDGVQKMSKSLGNAIGLAEPAAQAYGKLMSISDNLMIRYAKLLLHKDIDFTQENPMLLKKTMAYLIVEKFWSQEEAMQAQERFEKLFQQKDLSQAHPFRLAEDTPNPLWIVDLIKLLGGATSSSQARQLIEAGAIAINGTKMIDSKMHIAWNSGDTVKIGKHKYYTLIR